MNASKILENFEITGPDADGLVWLVLHGKGTTGRAMFNLGESKNLATQVALEFEKDRRAALAQPEPKCFAMLTECPTCKNRPGQCVGPDKMPKQFTAPCSAPEPQGEPVAIPQCDLSDEEVDQHLDAILAAHFMAASRSEAREKVRAILAARKGCGRQRTAEVGSGWVMDWQPIETAPTDGTYFLAIRGYRVREMYRVQRDDCNQWIFGGNMVSPEWSGSFMPTHWMPLPPPPKGDK